MTALPGGGVESSNPTKNTGDVISFVPDRGGVIAVASEVLANGSDVVDQRPHVRGWIAFQVRRVSEWHVPVEVVGEGEFWAESVLHVVEELGERRTKLGDGDARRVHARSFAWTAGGERRYPDETSARAAFGERLSRRTGFAAPRPLDWGAYERSPTLRDPA